MKYRITIEEVLPEPDQWDRAQYNDVYQQTVDDLDINELAVFINAPLQYHAVPQQEIQNPPASLGD